MVLLERHKERVYLEEIEVGGKIIFKRVIKFDFEEVKLIGVFQDGDNGIAFVLL